jgi:hypothetical protein
MLKKKNILWIGLLILLSCQWVCAQTPPDQTKEVTGRKAWIMTTAMPDDVTNPLKIISDGELEELKIYTRSIGQPVKVDATGIVRAVKEVIGEDGEVLYENLSMSIVPEGVREALIVLVPRKAGAGGLRFNSKVIDLAEFKAGGILYVNLVGTSIGIAIGKHKAVVKPGGMEFINPLEGSNKAVIHIGFFYEVPAKPNAEWKLMTSFKMAIYESRREICIFFYNPKIENVDFRGVPFITPKPTQR